jgi:hypothetical protein
MRTLAKAVSGLALVGTLAPTILFMSGSMNLSQMKTWMLVATVVWFIATPVWMDRKSES